jgi:hypothetical protein
MVTALSPADADRFFHLYGALHVYANEQLHVLPGVRTEEDWTKVTQDDRVRLRDALYDHPELFDRFIAENPARLSAEELEVVQKWSVAHVRGNFYLLRHLKRYSIFLSAGQPAHAYGVIGLTEEIDDLFPSFALPVYLQTVLLPFQGKIVWDGLVHYYNIVFGPGIRSDLNETYQRVKQREGIIESLPFPGEAAKAPARPRTTQPDLRPIVQQIVELSERLRPGATPLQRRAFSLLRAAAQLVDTATKDPTDLQAIGEHVRVVTRAYRQLATTYERETEGDEA